jgi:hypothetical protein
MRSLKKPSEDNNISEIATAGAAAPAPGEDLVRISNRPERVVPTGVLGVDHALKGGCAKLYASRIMTSEGKRILTLGDVALTMQLP